MDATADDEPDDVRADGRANVDGEPDDASAGEPEEPYDGPYDDYEPPVPLGVDSGDVVASATRKYGRAGGALAAGMFAVDVLINGEKKKPESVQVQEAASQPIDVDKSGIQVMIDELTSVEAPPLDRREPLAMKKKRSRRR